MTTARLRAARISISAFLIAVACACGNSTSVYRLLGAGSDFCVPRALDATPPRPRAANPIRGGFVLKGCFSEDGKGPCIGPSQVSSISVTESGSFQARFLEEFAPDSHVRLVAQNGWASAHKTAAGYYEIPDADDPSKTFLWRSIELSTSKSAELLATCVEHDIGTLCSRQFHGGDYVAGYAVIQYPGMQFDFVQLDSEVASVVQQLRCSAR